ncbi:MAG TPA: sigma-54 dependent transcriptional regulator, partial [Thermodesulfobacteriota bacterium]|nr:sigma-54 dependent transcriptional regulator [Thermodesulfobacteriota bacterium]
MGNILIIDDDRLICDAVSSAVKRMGHNAVCTSTLQEGLKAARSGPFDLVFLDVKMPDGNGLDILPGIRETPSAPEVIIITGYGNPDGAELAIKNGAWDYIEKPCSLQAMTLPLVRALQYREEKQTKGRPVHLKREGIVGTSRKMESCFDLVAQAAASDANVLITGETGTGKELIAWAIHKNSRRAEKNFVVVDCAALPETLVESIIFGHEKGAYTGADRAREGLVSQANGGTLFLDEVAELPPSIQASFLRVLHERRFRPIGRKDEVSSDFRLIAASNRNLPEMVKRHEFREDLLFRLQAFPIEIPPLRERREDIRELIRYYVPKLCENYGIPEKRISPDLIDILVSYPWPGNVRELIHALERAISGAPQDPVLFPKHLPTNIRVGVARASVGEPAQKESPASAPVKTLPKLQKFRETAISEAERNYLKELLSLTQGNIPKACDISGLSRSRLYAL